MDDETKAELARAHDAVWTLKIQVTALRFAVNSMAETHPNLPALIASYDRAAEHAIADSLTRLYPEPIIDRIRIEVDGFRDFLHGMLREQATKQIT